MDSVQREVAQQGYRFADARPVHGTAADGTSVGLHKPGFRVARENLTGDSADAAAHIINNARQRTAEHYQLYDAEKSREYLTPTGAHNMRPAAVGSVCAVQGPEFPLDFGSEGIMQMYRGKLTCVPINPRSDEDRDTARAQDGIRRRRKQLRDPQGREAGTEEGEEEPEATATHYEPDRPVNTGDARVLQQKHAARMGQLYDALDAELTNRWRHP
jgi:hypothetical protein